jgi:hypothetical protein
MANKKRAALRALMKKVPEGDMILHILGHSGPHVKNPALDRTAAITGATFLEYALREAICCRFAPDPLDQTFSYIFEQDDAPYREFAGRKRLARALGIISKVEYDKLEAIRHIRNAFAHTMAPISFDTPEIVALCDDLAIAGSDAPDDFPLNRKKFMLAVINFYLRLTHQFPSDADAPPS